MESDKKIIEMENAKRELIETIGKELGLYKLLDFLSKLLKGKRV